MISLSAVQSDLRTAGTEPKPQAVQADVGLDPDVRRDWTLAEARAIYGQPFNDLLFQAHGVHRRHFDPNRVQKSTLSNIKTGGCAEDCAYCSQSSRYDTGLKASKLLAIETVIAEAKAARDSGASRFCMGAAWRSPKDRDMDALCDMVGRVKGLGLETCMTLGMLNDNQVTRLRDAGLDYYNHNIDTSEDFYDSVITTRTFQDRLDTLARVRDSGMKVCCGGIVGMGEEDGDRISMLVTLATLPEHPESVPINMLVPIPGTPMGDLAPLHPIEFVRTIATARVMMPRSYVRLSAGRMEMSDELQALCFFAGANSVFSGEKLLTTANNEVDRDSQLFGRLGVQALVPETLGAAD